MDAEKKQRLFKYIEKLSTVRLSDDPAEAGLSDLNNRIAEISNNRSKATVLSNKLIRMLSDKNRQLVKLQSIYDLKFSQLLASNERVKEASSKDERQSIAKLLLRKEVRELDIIKDKIAELEMLDKCMQSCLQALKTAKESISRQLSVLNHQMELGEVDKTKFADS